MRRCVSIQLVGDPAFKLLRRSTVQFVGVPAAHGAAVVVTDHGPLPATPAVLLLLAVVHRFRVLPLPDLKVFRSGFPGACAVSGAVST